MEVVYTSPWVPVEWILAHGHTARGIWSMEAPASTVSLEGVCAFAQSVAQLAAGVSGSVFVTTTACDQLRRAADGLCGERDRGHGVQPFSGTGTGRVFLFNLPAVWQSPAGRRLYQDELGRLGRFLVEVGGQSPTDAQLREIVQSTEEQKARLRAFLQENPARSGVEALTAWLGQGMMPPTMTVAGDGREGVPLALLGGPLRRSHWSLFDAIVEVGGRVVLNGTEPGERCLTPPLAEEQADRPAAIRLADHYFDHVIDVFSRPNTRLYEWLRRRLKETAARGLVLWTEVGCDLWRAEAPSLREAFGLPVLLLDGQGGLANLPRDQNRLSALVESLR